jgi:hypothetical protein
MTGGQLKLSDVAVVVIATVIAPSAVICVYAEKELVLDLVVSSPVLVQVESLRRIRSRSTAIASQTETIPLAERLS